MSAMLAHRDEFLAADTDAKLYYALTKLTCARWDGHLNRVRLVQGGIQPFAAQTQAGGAAPIKFKPDYTNRAAMFLFVSDFAKDIARIAGPNAKRTPQLGDKLVGVNGQPADVYLKRLGQFVGQVLTPGASGGILPTGLPSVRGTSRRRSLTAIA